MKNLKIIFCIIFLGTMFYESSAIALTIRNTSWRVIKAMDAYSISDNKIITGADWFTTWKYGTPLLFRVCTGTCTSNFVTEWGPAVQCSPTGSEITITGVTQDDKPIVSGCT